MSLFQSDRRDILPFAAPGDDVRQNEITWTWDKSRPGIPETWRAARTMDRATPEVVAKSAGTGSTVPRGRWNWLVVQAPCAIRRYRSQKGTET